MPLPSMTTSGPRADTPAACIHNNPQQEQEFVKPTIILADHHYHPHQHDPRNSLSKMPPLSLQYPQPTPAPPPPPPSSSHYQPPQSSHQYPQQPATTTQVCTTQPQLQPQQTTIPSHHHLNGLSTSTIDTSSNHSSPTAHLHRPQQYQEPLSQGNIQTSPSTVYPPNRSYYHNGQIQMQASGVGQGVGMQSLGSTANTSLASTHHVVPPPGNGNDRNADYEPLPRNWSNGNNNTGNDEILNPRSTQPQLYPTDPPTYPQNRSPHEANRIVSAPNTTTNNHDYNDERRQVGQNPKIYDVRKLRSEGCTMNDMGQVVNRRGFRICGVLNQHERPCQRIGRCPFHHTIEGVVINGNWSDLTGSSGIFNECENNGEVDRVRRRDMEKRLTDSGCRKPYKRGWTKEEHFLFLKGLRIHGKGRWKAISSIVTSRTPTQIQSHAQKYFLRQNQVLKNKKSIHDLTLDSDEMKKIGQDTNLSAHVEASLHNLDPANIQTNLHAQAYNAIASGNQTRNYSSGELIPGKNIVKSVYGQQASANLNAGSSADPTGSPGAVLGNSYENGFSANAVPASSAMASTAELAPTTDDINTNGHLTSNLANTAHSATGHVATFGTSIRGDLGTVTAGGTTTGMASATTYSGPASEPHRTLANPSSTAHPLLTQQVRQQQQQEQQQPHRSTGTSTMYATVTAPQPLSHTYSLHPPTMASVYTNTATPAKDGYLPPMHHHHHEHHRTMNVKSILGVTNPGNTLNACDPHWSMNSACIGI